MRRAGRALPAAGFLAALAVRVAFLLGFRGNFDVGSYEEVAGILERGGDLYGETARYNYAPVWAYVVSGVSRLAEALHVSFASAVGVLLLASDAATAWVLYRLAGRGRRGTAAALLFFANPVSVLATGHYLQFDNLAILFLLLAILFAQREPPARWRAAAALSASLLVKHVTAFFPLALAGRRDRRGIGLAAATAPYLFFAASFLPFRHSWASIRANVFGYAGGTEDYGVGMLRSAVPSWALTAVFFLAVGAAILLTRELELSRACLILFLAMLIFTPGVNEYYFVWPIALGSLSGGAGYFVYTLVVTGFFVGGSLEGLRVPFTHFPGWNGVWWSLVFWAAWEARRRRSILSHK